MFHRILESDRNKLKLEGCKQIIQTAGINVSASKFMDILAFNQGVHIYAMETELVKVYEAFSRKGGLEFSYLRNAFDNDDWEKSVAEFTFDFNISRKKILKQTTNKELENISVETEEGTVTLKDIFLNKLQSSISADVPEKLFQKYDVELRGTDSKGNKVRYELKDDAETEAISRNWKFKTDFWRTYGSAGDDERPEIPNPDSEYLELQLYLKSDDIMESNITETYDLDDDTYAEEEGKVYDVADDSEWKAVGEKIRINIR